MSQMTQNMDIQAPGFDLRYSLLFPAPQILSITGLEPLNTGLHNFLNACVDPRSELEKSCYLTGSYYLRVGRDRRSCLSPPEKE